MKLRHKEQLLNRATPAIEYHQAMLAWQPVQTNQLAQASLSIQDLYQADVFWKLTEVAQDMMSWEGNWRFDSILHFKDLSSQIALSFYRFWNHTLWSQISRLFSCRLRLSIWQLSSGIRRVCFLRRCLEGFRNHLFLGFQLFTSKGSPFTNEISLHHTMFCYKWYRIYCISKCIASLNYGPLSLYSFDKEWVSPTLELHLAS